MNVRGWVRIGFFGLAWSLGGVLIYSGGVKMGDAAAFARAIGNYRLLPAFAASLAAVCLPWWEVFAGAAVMVPGLRRPGLLLGAGMFTAFLLANGSAWLRGLDIACGCFGPGGHRPPAAFFWDLALLAVTAAVWAADSVKPGQAQVAG